MRGSTTVIHLHDGVRWLGCLGLAVLVCLPPADLAAGLQEAERTAAAEHHFETRIRPVLLETCFPCHGGQKTGGGLNLGSRDGLVQGGESGPAIVAGQPEQSLLLRAIRRDSEVLPMPPANVDALRPDQIADFGQWIAAGAVWPQATPAFAARPHWSFQALQAPPMPQVVAGGWGRGPLDLWIRAHQEAAGLRPLPPADKRTLIRRATFDLTGLPPTAAEVAAFLRDDSPDAFAHVVERLLDSPAYGEQWGRHWLDIVRYADTAGETADYPVPTAWRYRNYVIDAFHTDKPYDRFLREQIAGDLLAEHDEGTGDFPTDDADSLTATGFLAISRRFGFDSENYQHLTIQDTIDTLGQAFLGLGLGCARCHDHKFDPITREDYYGLYGIFASTRYAFPGSEQKQRVRALVPLVPPADARRAWREFEFHLADLAEQARTHNQPVPSAVLRSLSDYDGDFELQAPAAGGSLGVLVPPWLFGGNIAVTTSAQSPYQHLHPRGQVGVRVDAGEQPYWFRQMLPPWVERLQAAAVYASFDFRLPAEPTADSKFGHRVVWRERVTGVESEVLIAAGSLSVRCGERVHTVGPLLPNTWYSVQLEFRRTGPEIRGQLAGGEKVQELGPWELDARWPGSWSELEVSPAPQSSGGYPTIELDNFAVEEVPMPPARLQRPSTAAGGELALWIELDQQIRRFVGIDGDLELQSADAPPAEPWNPGPHSVVAISREAQSPFDNVYPPGEQGVHLPRRAEYDGFGLNLAAAELPANQDLVASFDFRCIPDGSDGAGTWRYYLGQGPGVAATVELYFNARALFRRSGDVVEQVAVLQPGTWYQIQLTIDRQQRTYRGSVTSSSSTLEFDGTWASASTGVIDYTFIDSYGNAPGVRPALDADNFAIQADPFPPSSGPRQMATANSSARRGELAKLRARRSALQVDAAALRREMLDALADGPVPLAYAVCEGTPQDVPLQVRGEPTEPGPLIRRGFPAACGGYPLPATTVGSGRKELAEWLTNPAHPLTARVFVNRVWQWHFGEGLVATPNDFGARGLPPTHPELLDYLAAELIRAGWSLKALHRQIMLSATYQQATAESNDPVLRQAYVGFPRRRLSAEEIRDSLLAVCGTLEPPPVAGHPFPSPAEWGYTQHAPFLELYDHRHRSVYLMTSRIKRHPFLSLFDGADPNASTPRRFVTTVPTQALFFMNDPLVHEQATAWAIRLQAAAADTPTRMELAYAEAWQRTPTTPERERALQFLADYAAAQRLAGQDEDSTAAWAAYLRTILASNEFLYVD